MNPLNFNLSLSGMSALGALLVLLGMLLWLCAVVVVATRRTLDPFDRIAWLMVVLSLNIIGAILYFIFAAHKKDWPDDFRPHPDNRPPRNPLPPHSDQPSRYGEQPAGSDFESRTNEPESRQPEPKNRTNEPQRPLQNPHPEGVQSPPQRLDRPTPGTI